MGCQDQEAVRVLNRLGDGLQVLATVVIGGQHSCKCVQTACGNALQDCKEIRLRGRMRPQRHGQTDGFERKGASPGSPGAAGRSHRQPCLNGEATAFPHRLSVMEA